MLRIALAQINVTVGDLSGNREKMLAYIKKARKQQADIVVFPELSLCGYPPEDLLYKNHFVKDNLKELQKLAKEVSGIAVVIGFVDQDKESLYNAAAVIADGKIRGIYHKESLPNYGVFDEKRYFKEGRKNPMFSFQGIPLGVNICEDIWIKDGVYRKQARQGAKILINLSSSPYDVGKLEQREELLVDCARKNKVFICYVNLVGGQDELVFDGGSLVIDNNGEIIASGKQFEEDLVVVDLDVLPRKVKQKTKRIVIPCEEKTKKVLGKQKARKFSQIERIYKALVLGTRDYVYKNGFHKVVVGLSGGIDSSVVAVIAREAIGKRNVIGITMPSQYSSSGTQADAKKLAKNLGIKILEVPINEIFNVYKSALKKAFLGAKEDVTEENLQARIRGNILMAFSNKFGWLVLTTGNKSELAVGYCTLYGDMSGGFAVIKDVPKTYVYELARLINAQKKNIIPKSILTRAPSAELKEGQKDQDSLPDYKTLDSLIEGYVEDHQSLEKIVKKTKNLKAVKEMIKLIDKSEYKRRQAPPGIKITSRAFGKDWRLPITNKYKEF